MQTAKSITSKLLRPGLLAVLVLMAFSYVSKASTVGRFYVWNDRYGWVLLAVNSNTGGAFRWDASRGCYITDRAMRGEYMYANIQASFPGEPYAQSGLVSTRGTTGWGWHYLPAQPVFQVPLDPNADNVCVWTESPWSVRDAKRIPIGGRP